MSDGKPATLIPFYALELHHLVHAKAKVVVICKACHKRGEADVVDLIHKLGPTHSVKHAERRLVCSGCLQRGWAMVRVEWL